MGNQRGQSLVEYVLVLVIGVALAVTAVRLFPRALGGYYRHLASWRAGILGMRP